MGSGEKWSVCRTHKGKPCLYTERGREAIEDRSPNHPAYCVKHREELVWDYALYGLTREDARKALTEREERAKREI